MSLNKAISSGKEKRKIYRGAKAHDRSCRNHGTCPYCLNNRKYQENKSLDSAAELEKDYLTEEKESL